MKAFDGFRCRRAPDIVLRPIVDADMRFLSDLYASTRAQELAQTGWPVPMQRDFLAQQFALQHRHYSEHYADADFFLLLRDAEPIGRIYLHRSGGEINIVDIALLPPCCGKGLGSALLAEVIDEAAATKSKITLHVEPNNPAYRLYERLGFGLVEHRGVYDYLEWLPSRPDQIS